MGQLESLREPNIAQPDFKKKKKNAIVVNFDENFSES
jgi:hypothetical protein